MTCPKCHAEHSIVVHTQAVNSHVMRLRLCPMCQHQWRTIEVSEKEYQAMLQAETRAIAKAHAGRILAVLAKAR